MTAARAGAVMGRPITTFEGAERALERARDRNRDLSDELRAERLEGTDFARRVRALGTRLEAAGQELGSPSVMQAGLELGYHASRFLRQRPEGAR